MTDLSDMRPLVLINAMLACLLEDVLPNRLFLRQLPADMQDHLAAQDLMMPAAMIAVVNRLFDARLQGASVAAVSDLRARTPSPAGHNRSSYCQDPD
jgi:hypothetical protein